MPIRNSLAGCCAAVEIGMARSISATTNLRSSLATPLPRMPFEDCLKTDRGYPVELARGGEQAPGAADLVGIERRLDEQDQPLDADARERLPSARVRPEPPLVEPRGHRDDEAGPPATRGLALVARNAHQVGEPRRHRLRVEPGPGTAG